MSETTDSELDEKIIDQLAAIRELGTCNMVDMGCVKNVARQCEFTELAELLDDRRRAQEEYMAHLEAMGERR